MSIGTYLRRLRKQKGFSIRQVVMKSEGLLDKTTVSRIERGERNLSVRALYAFSRIYDVPADKLLVYLVREHIDSASIPFDFNDEERLLVERYRTLSRRGQNTIRELLTAISRPGEAEVEEGEEGVKTVYTVIPKPPLHRPAVTEDNGVYKGSGAEGD